MKTNDFIKIIDKITDIEEAEKRIIVLDFFIKNGVYFNINFSPDIFYSRYIVEMERKGEIMAMISVGNESKEFAYIDITSPNIVELEIKTDKFPQPKFEIGQRVYIKENYTMKTKTDKIYIVVQIMLSCLSILRYPEEKKEEPFDYMLIDEKWLGKIGYNQNMRWNCRESFIVGVKDEKTITS